MNDTTAGTGVTNVLPETDSGYANGRYGERYSVDWQYANPVDPHQMAGARYEHLVGTLSEALCKHVLISEWLEYARTVLDEPLVQKAVEGFVRAVQESDKAHDQERRR